MPNCATETNFPLPYFSAFPLSLPLSSRFISFRYPRCALLSTPSGHSRSLSLSLFLFPALMCAGGSIGIWVASFGSATHPSTPASFLHHSPTVPKRYAASHPSRFRAKFNSRYSCVPDTVLRVFMSLSLRHRARIVVIGVVSCRGSRGFQRI